MRISARIGLVGGIPIAVAAALALFAWLLLNEAEQARDGALLAASVYRNLLSVVNTRNNYVNPLSNDRVRDNARFQGFAAQARRELGSLGKLARNGAQRSAIASASEGLARYTDRMSELVEVTGRNDRLISEMGSRAIALVNLTDQARERQHAANTEIVASLREQDGKLRWARDIVDEAHELRIALADLDVAATAGRLAPAAPGPDAPASRLSFALARIRHSVDRLGDLLRAGQQSRAAGDLARLAAPYDAPAADASRDPPAAAAPAGRELADWCDRLLKINSSQQRSLHDEVAQLLAYSVAAGDTEQATQNIAITTLKLGQRTNEALATRNVAASDAILGESKALTATVVTLPISPLIQSEMIDALAQWRGGLVTTTAGLRNQNDIIADMDGASEAMTTEARSLNDLFTAAANRIGASIRRLLLYGAGVGLLLGSATALVVARSITRPLRRLQQGMLELAADPSAGNIGGTERADELGQMARAADFFVTEIAQREQALREAKDRADEALAALQRTQGDLIRAEKLASLGGLVAGVAHEINTPVGIALTTATVMADEAKRFGGVMQDGQLRRSELTRFTQRVQEGSQLLFANLTRAADLVHSFKQVSADQASGERRRFGFGTWLRELLTSLGPALRRANLQIVLRAPDDLSVDTYPGALAQVLTNLIMNAVVHGYDGGQGGELTLSVSAPRPGDLRIVVEDNGKGIPPAILGRVFDPFFTTGRSRGNTGLGLHIAYNLVTGTLQGKIDVASELGVGTRFTIDLPTQIREPAGDRLLAASA